MASYTITTTRKQEIGLKFSYDTYADKTVYTTQQAWLQSRVNLQVLDAMYAEQQNAASISFDQSFATVPELQQPAARTEIEGVITSHGGSIIPPGPVGPPLPTAISNPTGTLPAARGTSGNPVQIGGGIKKANESGGRDGGGDIEIEESESGLDESGKGSKGTSGD